MIEIRGNLWSVKADWKCITTNGYVKADGRAVMGRGCAAEAKTLFTGIDATLGRALHLFGRDAVNGVTPTSVVYCGQVVPLYHDEHYGTIVSYPVKREWNKPALLWLISRSAKQLRFLAEAAGWPKVVLPRPGCGNGNLDWQQVRPILEAELPEDSFQIITF